MTQKELAYVEDAIGHEKIMIELCNETIKGLKTKELREFMQEELTNHEEIYNDLLIYLEGQVND